MEVYDGDYSRLEIIELGMAESQEDNRSKAPERNLKYLHKCGVVHVHVLDDLIVNMTIVPELIYRFYALPIRN